MFAGFQLATNKVSFLCRSIELEPKLLDAYWHRHLLHLLQDNRKVCLSVKWSFLHLECEQSPGGAGATHHQKPGQLGRSVPLGSTNHDLA